MSLNLNLKQQIILQNRLRGQMLFIKVLCMENKAVEGVSKHVKYTADTTAF